MRHIFRTLLIACLILLTTPLALVADRPGSYDNVLGGNPGAAAGGRLHFSQRHVRAVPGRACVGSSIHLGVGLGVPVFPFFTSPLIGYGAIGPGWNHFGWNPRIVHFNWSPYGIYYNPAANITEYYLPPTYVPAELYYGPQAVNRFLGAGLTPAAMPPALPAAPDVPAATAPAGIAERLRESNDAAKERARRFLQFGDALFLKQRFHEAAQRYRSAIEAAPDLAEAYYRQGFALLGVKQYRLAAKALRIAVELDPMMLRDEKLLLVLYGDNHLVKEAHLEELAAAALEAPENGDIFFCIGAFLYANDEPLRAAKFLRRAVDLADPKPDFLDPLLEPAVPAAAMERDT